MGISDKFIKPVSQPTAYQQNLAQPVQTKPEEPWSTRRVMGNIARTSSYDPQKAQQMFDDLMYLQTDASSKYYNPYVKASNRAVDNLAGYGIDTSQIDDKFFHDNDYLIGYLSYNGQTNTPTKPGKKASEAEKAAWEYYQIKIAEDATKKVEQQWSALQDELNYWANRKDRNYSDDEIINRIDWKKYGALTDLETKQRDGKPAELNRGTTFSRDAMYGVLWAARNGGSSGSIYGDMARSYNGEGTPWRFDQTTADKLNPKSENYNPYSVGSTIDDAALYFNVDKFDQGWLQQNDGMQYGQDETAKKMYQKVLAAEGVTQKAEQELDELNAWVDRKLQNAKTAEAADKILNRIDWNKYPTLAKMDQTIGKGDMPGSGDLLQLTRAVDYKYSDLEKKVRDACYENSKIPMDVEYVDDLDAMTGVAPVQTTDIDSSIVKDQNKRLEDAADLFDGAGTGSEQSMGKNLWSTAFGWVKDGVSQALNAIPGKFTELTQKTITDSIGNLSSSMLTDADVVQNYNIAQSNIPKLQQQKAELEAQMGSGADYLSAGKFDRRLTDEDGNVSLSGQKGWNLLTDSEKGYLSTVLNTADDPNDVMDIVEEQYNKYLSNHAGADEETINAYRDVTNQLADAEAYVAANQATYDEATANTKSAQEQYDALISMFDNAGLDSTELKKARTVSDFLLGFTKYDPTTWESENVYAEYSHMAMQNDGSFDKMYQVAEQTDKEILDNIELAQWVLEYSDKNGVQMPDSVRNNVQRWLNAMQRQHEDFENLAVLKNADKDEMVAKGREMAANTPEFDWNAYDGNLESQPAWNLLSEEQKQNLLSMASVYDINDVANQMNGYLEGMDIENKLFGTYRMSDLLMDYEKETFYYKLATEGLEGANAYIDHLADASYGVLNTRAAEKTRESADALAGSGFWGRRAADVLSMLMSPAAAIGSAYYMAEVGLAKLRGEDVEVNPNNVNLSANIYKKEARGKIQEEIKKTYGKQIVNEDGSITYEDTPLSQFMSGLQEIISNRGDSMVNAVTFGPLFKGIAPEMLNEFMSATPMAFAAATDAVADAKDKGASDTQLLGIFAATFLAEAGTEAISIDNMREAFGMGGAGFTGAGVREFVRNWLTKAGISEMFGESLNDIIENTADEIIMGDQSEYAQLVNKYKTEEHMSQEDAELAARRDQMMGVLHTALISYLSPGMDIVSYTAGTFNSARQTTRDLQKAGYDVSIFDVMRMDKEQRNRANAEQTEVQNEQAETTEETAPAEETAPTAETQEQTEVRSEENAETAVVENEADKAVEIDPEEQKAQRIAADYQILDNAGKADAASQTASVAAVLQTEQTDAASDMAKATAAKLADVLGGLKFRGVNLNPTEFLKNLWLGASETNTDLNTLKTAIQNAILGGEESAAYQQLTTAKFRKADYDAQVQRLANTVEADQNNPAVQSEINKNIHESRIVEAEGQIIASGGQLGGSKINLAQKAQQTLDKTAKTLMRMKTDLEAKQNELTSASNALNQASADLRQNPTDENKKRVVGAVSKYNSAAAVVQEYEQGLAKAESDHATAEENANRLREEALTEIRQQAEQIVAQQDEQRAGRIAQEQQIAQQEAEQAAAVEAVTNEVENIARNDADAYIEEQYPNATEEEKQTIRDMFNRIQNETPANPVTRDEAGQMTPEAVQRRDKFVQQISKKFGINIAVEDTTKGGVVDRQNGYYDRRNNRIVIDQDATIDDAMFFVLGHELTHVAEQSDTYRSLAGTLVRMRYGYDDAKLAADIRARKALYDERLARMHEQDNSINATPLTEEEASQEIVADIMGDLLRGDENLINRLAAEEPSTARRIIESIKSFLKKAVGMKGAWVSDAQRTVDMLEKALKEAQGNNSQAKQEYVVPKDAYTIRKSMYSDNPVVRINSYIPQEYRNALESIGMKMFNDERGWGFRVNRGKKVTFDQISEILEKPIERNDRYSLDTVSKPIVTDDEGNAIAEELPGGTVVADRDVSFSLSSWTDKEIAKVRQNLLKNGFTAEQANKWINDVNSIAAIIAQDKDRLDFTPDRNQKFKKPNGDVYKWTLDASTLCAKRLLYQGTFNEIQKLMPNTPLYAGDLIELSNMMREMGYQTPCGICYVESQRRDSGKFTEEFIQKYAKEHEGEFIPTFADLTTSDGLYRLRDEHKEVYDAYIKANNARGSGSTKPVQLRTDYRGDVRNLTSDSIEYLKEIGGLRINSFSDFETPHLMDMMQAVLDMAAVKLTSQAYTKVPNFAAVFGDTGIKINLSLMGDGNGLDENGNLIFSSTEGMDFDEAMKLRDRYSKNVGTILVGMNDAQIKAAMADPRIDFIIPFHRSGWSEENRQKMTSLANYKDYQDYQNERDIKTGKKAASNIEPGYVVNEDGTTDGYWDYNKSGKENAETYLKLCAEKGLIPKFEQFLVNNGDGSYSLQPDGSTDGYWKTLIDFKMYENDGDGSNGEVKGSPQTVVTPNINMEEAYRVLNEFDGTGVNSLPVAQPVVDRYVEEYKAKHPERTKFSLPQDADYLAAVERGDMESAQRDVETAAKQAGYTNHLYHGTNSFGFTQIDNNAPGADGFSFWATDNPDAASTYTRFGNVRPVNSEISPEEIENIRNEVSDKMDDAISKFRHLIDHTFSEWYFGMEGNSMIRDAVDKANPEPGHGDGVYDVLEEYVYDAFDSYGEYLGNEYDDVGEWMEESEEGQAIADAIVNIEAIRSQINELENGDINGGIYDLYANTDNFYVIDAEGKTWNQLRPEGLPNISRYGNDDAPYRTRDVANWARENGYDGVLFKNILDNGAYGRTGPIDVYAFFNPQSQVKSADTVTYDDNGNVIPLSERFNTNEPDIRYSLPSENLLEQQIRNYLQRGGSLKPSNPVAGIRQWGNEGAQQSDVLAREAQDYVLNSPYAKDTNAKELARAIQWIESNKSNPNSDGYYESLQKITSPGFNYRTKDGQARMIAMMGMAVAHDNDVNAQIALADAYNKQGTAIGQALQARKLFRLMTPEGRIAVMRKMLNDTQDQINRKGTNIKLAFSQWVYDAAANAADENDFAKVQQAAAAELAEQLPSNWKDKARSIRMLSMLGNPRTHIRNIIGNMLFVPAVGMKNKLGAIGEILSRQENRTKTLAPFLNKEVKQFAREDALKIKDTLTGEAKYNEGDMVKREQKPFKGLLQAVIDFNGNMLEKEDWIFLKGHYRRALGGWMQANGYTAEQLRNDSSLLDQGRAYAIQEAQKATYRDFSKMAQTLNQVSRNGGVAGFIVDAALPFKKTPANILKRGLEYSPAGIMKSLTADLYHLKQWHDFENGKLNALPEKAISPTEFIDHLCSGLAGTAIMAMGALLANSGFVSCGLDDDDDELEKLKGNQKYAFRANILGKDITFTMDWAAPMSMPFFVGAAIQNQLAKGGDLDADELINAFANITEPVFNLSMLDGINTVFKTSQYDDTNTLTQIGAKIVSNYVTSYVPSVIGAIARTIDDKQRKNFVESGKGTGVLGTFLYAAEQVQNKIPGLNQQNIAVRDVWGNEETTGLVERILENFILPGYVNEYKDDPLLNEIGRVADATQDYSIVPSDPPKSFSYKNQKIVLTDKQWDAYKRDRGQTAFDMLNDLIKNPDYQNASPATQADMINKVWSYADKMGKKAVIPDFDMVTNTVDGIAGEGKIDGYKNEMLKALQLGDIDAYETMVEALHDEEVDDSEIKKKIQDTYINKYKEAYRTGDYETMADIQDIFDDSGFDFNTDAWEEAVDKKYGI